MKRIIAEGMLFLFLSGCASMFGNGPIAMSRRNAYLQAHPHNTFSREILSGQVSVGMSMADVDAMWGSECSVYQTAAYGTTYNCKTNMLADQYDPGMMVLFDNSDHVVSWVN
jgi:hypothetical protein